MTITISAVILAGGQAKRMGGADKGLQLFHGEPLFMRVYQRLQAQVEQISVNANRNQARYAQSGLPVFADELSGFQGPLSGMLTALERATTDFVLFAPCDTPFLPLDLAEKLQSAVENRQVFAAYAHDGEREHPTCCLLATSLKDPLARYLQQDQRKILQFLREQHAVAVYFNEQKQAFLNVNTPEDLKTPLSA
ncbi:molybdenum cofactor guanylyltransferase MobA [Caviibacterium pharyngocola]|uniref:Molybdenum cofactor guanylyltransferase n=1 Tax=Caviibacterium pharyngocola TaxID=28159 RepID=A0A2M8RT51_9PAST|nr:molybdenum cofactor guanylyltransferase MobA [Caviibacterium pharyngocola]PJG82061.1 molybdenum cofactor guanylyltransferase MobA [Caviibacterium pharyngocola]